MWLAFLMGASMQVECNRDLILQYVVRRPAEVCWRQQKRPWPRWVTA